MPGTRAHTIWGGGGGADTHLSVVIFVYLQSAVLAIGRKILVQEKILFFTRELVIFMSISFRVLNRIDAHSVSSFH